ncbi:hypothetical protein LZG75_12040 [Polynucleobacter sp. IMCC30063]|uniref:hypothetical protein n=1 Tax=Polynucleobacter sp. IMCC30063 TaxID=2907298 RepID=UPI001F2C4802|nr:hypothetical protein [Polynucleobacter sp. IMCC30063]MCE7506959.1 hypothetical protein [Polynucleobacter sp. IMCC30063]
MKKMIYDQRTSLQFHKKWEGKKDFVITHQGFGDRRSGDTPRQFSILTINKVAYSQKKESQRERYPYSEAIFKGRSLDLCIYTDCPADWYGNSGSHQFIRMDSVDEDDPLTIFWNVGTFESIAVIQNSIFNANEISINLFLDVRESYFRDLDRKLCHEVKISSITLDCL